jgi:transmembrane sensor
MAKEDFYKQLIRRYRDNKASTEEVEALFNLVDQGKLEGSFEEIMNEEINTLNAAPVIPLYKQAWFRVAASVLLLLGVFAIYRFQNNKPSKTAQLASVTILKNDVAPGGNKATLTLANGTTIILDNAHSGALATQGNTQVLKLNDGQLQYKESSEVSPSGGDLEGAFNTMSTPRGGQYQLTLSDGTKVWLNAASSLRYPATFTGKDRQVELNGEAYFEVAHNAAMPFKVNVAGKEEVEVLGTHFNINSYSDEPAVKTTLLEGSVKVTPAINTTISTQLATILKPGEQAQMQAGGKINRQTNVDIGKVMAWKNNIFNFNNENIESIMRQLSRWYNVDIRFEGTIPGIKFSGEIGRNLSLKQVLSILDETRIKYRIEGKTLVISS